MRTPARIALALAIFVSFACSGDDDAAPTTTVEATTTTVEATTTTEAAPETTLVARSEVDVIDVYEDAEGGEPIQQLDRRAETTGNLVFVVEDEGEADGRHRVQLPVRPNGSTGWVNASDVSLTVHDYRIEVELAAFELRVFKGDELVITTPIGVGTDDTPTPGGTYYIKELLQPPSPTGPYGTYAYGLSGFSNVLESFAGGNGVIGIHGTNQPDLIGTNVSHGCIRVENDVISELVEDVGLPLGVPVEILA